MFRSPVRQRLARLAAFTVAAVAVGSAVTAQDAAAPPTARRERAAAGAPVRFPFEYASGKIWIATTVNGKGPYWFALDTGAPPTVIDMDVAREVGLEVTVTGSIGGAGEGTTPCGTVERVTLGFGPFELRRKVMEATALGPRLDWANSRHVGGLIGNDWVIKHVVTIDYANQEITVSDPDTYEYHGDGIIVPTHHGAYTFMWGSITAATAATAAGGAPVGRERPGQDARAPAASAGDGAEPVRVKWMLDTGAGLSATLNTHVVRTNRLLEMPTPMIEASVGFGLGGEVRHRVCRLPRLTIGEAVIDAPVVTLSQDKAGALATGLFDGIIGGEILSKFTVTLDHKRHRMILEPNAKHALPIEFDMAGLSLVGPKRAVSKAGDDVGTSVGPGDGKPERAGLDVGAPMSGRLRVLRVVEGSPADEAGVLEGDEIVSIDGDAVTVADRDRVRARFREHGKERKVVLKRDGTTIEVTLKLRRLVRAEECWPLRRFA